MPVKRQLTWNIINSFAPNVVADGFSFSLTNSSGGTYNIIGPKTQKQIRSLDNYVAGSGAISANLGLIISDNIPDNCTLIFEVTFCCQVTNNATRYGAKLISTWSRENGVNTKIGDVIISESNNTGDTHSIATGGSFGNIFFAWSRTSGTRGYYYGGSAEITIVNE